MAQPAIANNVFVRCCPSLLKGFSKQIRRLKALILIEKFFVEKVLGPRDTAFSDRPVVNGKPRGRDTLSLEFLR